MAASGHLLVGWAEVVLAEAGVLTVVSMGDMAEWGAYEVVGSLSGERARLELLEFVGGVRVAAQEVAKGEVGDSDQFGGGCPGVDCGSSPGCVR